jgi:hypothetical protein
MYCSSTCLSFSRIELLPSTIDVLSSQNSNMFFLDELKGAFQPTLSLFRNHVSKSILESLNCRIEKKLESESFDEYDDFNPRHPQPRDKTHRRGGSYFNSDISEIVDQVRPSEEAINLSQIAIDALREIDDTTD